MNVFLLFSAVCALVGAAAAAAPVQQGPVENPLTVQVGIFALQPDGSAVGLAFGANARDFEPFAALMLSDGCRAGAGGKHAVIPAWARDAWRIGGRVISVRRPSDC